MADESSESEGLIGGLGGDKDEKDFLEEISNKLGKTPDPDMPSVEDIEEHLGEKFNGDLNTPQGKMLYNMWQYKEYDLDEDGEITENDVALAKANEATVIDALASLPQIPAGISKALSKNQFTDKELFIRYLAAQLYAYSDFDRHPVTVLINRAIQNATMLANKLFK